MFLDQMEYKEHQEYDSDKKLQWNFENTKKITEKEIPQNSGNERLDFNDRSGLFAMNFKSKLVAIN